MNWSRCLVSPNCSVLPAVQGRFVSELHNIPLPSSKSCWQRFSQRQWDSRNNLRRSKAEEKCGCARESASWPWLGKHPRYQSRAHSGTCVLLGGVASVGLKGTALTTKVSETSGPMKEPAALLPESRSQPKRPRRGLSKPMNMHIHSRQHMAGHQDLKSGLARNMVA